MLTVLNSEGATEGRFLSRSIAMFNVAVHRCQSKMHGFNMHRMIALHNDFFRKGRVLLKPFLIVIFIVVIPVHVHLIMFTKYKIISVLSNITAYQKIIHRVIKKIFRV